MNIFEDFCYTFVSKCTRYLRSERTQLSKMTQEMLKINDSRIVLLYLKDISGTFCVSWGFFINKNCYISYKCNPACFISYSKPIGPQTFITLHH